MEVVFNWAFDYERDGKSVAYTRILQIRMTQILTSANTTWQFIMNDYIALLQERSGNCVVFRNYAKPSELPPLLFVKFISDQ